MKKKFYQITNKSLIDLKVKNQKELWEKVKGKHIGLCACVKTEYIKKEDSDNSFSVIMSTSNTDRHMDVVEQNWDLKNFKKNPVFLDSHNYDSIEHIIGKVKKIKIVEGKLKGEIEFMLDNPKGLLAYKMALGGFLNATSVGFIPMEFDEKTGAIIKSELLENSAVSVPANAEALFEKKIKKIEKKIEENIEAPKEKNLKLLALKRIVENNDLRRKEILKETLAVIQRLSQREVDAEKRKQMVNRAIRQLIKIK